MFKKDDQKEQPKDNGPFTQAKITIGPDGSATITIPMAQGEVVVKTKETLLAAWGTDNVAGRLLAEAGKYKPFK